MTAENPAQIPSSESHFHYSSQTNFCPPAGNSGGNVPGPEETPVKRLSVPSRLRTQSVSTLGDEARGKHSKRINWPELWTLCLPHKLFSMLLKRRGSPRFLLSVTCGCWFSRLIVLSPHHLLIPHFGAYSLVDTNTQSDIIIRCNTTTYHTTFPSPAH